MKLKRLLYFAVAYFLYRSTLGPTPENTGALRKAKTVLDKVNVKVGAIDGNWMTPSKGNVIPVVSRPWGATHWTIANEKGENDGWWYQENSVKFSGIRVTNQCSPWTGDHSFFNVVIPGAKTFSELIMSPNYISLKVDTGERVEVVPWDHGGIIKISGGNSISFEHLENLEFISPTTLVAIAKKSSVFKREYVRYLTIRSKRPLGTDLKWVGNENELFIGLSYISFEQSSYNAMLLFNKGIYELKDEGEKIWEEKLTRAGPGDELHFTNLYRAMLFPKFISEYLPSRKQVHRSPFDLNGEIYPGPLVTGSGFWDSYRTVYPFLHQFFPEVVREIYSGWANAIREDPNGMLPQWSSPGRIGSMVGAMGEVSLCEGLLEGDIIDPQDISTIYDYLIRSVTNTEVLNGRKFLSEYLELGYVPSNRGESVSLTLNYMLADYVVGKCARLMGDYELATELTRRSTAWRNTIWDPKTKFFRPKTKDGKWAHQLDQYQWMDHYTEGGPWQYRFYVPHDIPGLIEVWGGEQNLCNAMLEMMTTSNEVSNRRKIHEEIEMQLNVWGQYAHNNQVVHHVLPMMQKISPFCAELAKPWIHRVLTELYTLDGYPGDEDNGEMAAWYILMKVGEYKLVPGLP